MVARSSSDLFFPPPRIRSSARAGQKPEEQRDQSLAEAVAGRDFFDQDRFTRDLQRNAIEQLLRGDDGFELALRRARRQRFVRGRVVQIHRHFPRERGGKIHERPRNGRRQQDADHLLPRPRASQPARQKNRAQQRAAPFHPRTALVPHREAERMTMRACESASDEACACARGDGGTPRSAVAGLRGALRTACVVGGIGLPKLTVTG